MKMQRMLAVAVLLGLLLSLAPMTVSAERTPTAHGIDVSHHQGRIDWDTAKNYIDFAIVRCGYGSDLESQDDRQWKNNADACTRLEIPFGVYIYSHATNEAQARSEASHVLRQLQGYEPALPIYLDLEDDDISDNCSKEQILKNATVFCDILEEAGYKVGIYANTYWWTSYLDDPAYDKWDRWVARYAAATGYDKDYTMWQYTSTGSVPGISGNVDMNYWYGDFPLQDCEHDYIESVSLQPDCTKAGLVSYTCRHCGDSYEKTLPALGHSWDEGTVTQAPTQTELGEKTYRCHRCQIIMTVSIPAHGSSCPSGAFEDVPALGHWAHEGIDYVVEKGLFSGVSETAFAPDGSMTRGMLVTVLWRYAGSPRVGQSAFDDVLPDLWYAQAVAWAAEEGIVTGVSPQRFDPDGKITREQMAAILYRYGEKKGIDTSGQADLSRYPDEGECSDYARSALSWACAEGLITGKEDHGINYLDPQGCATRAQVATIFMRFLEHIEG